MAWTNLKSAIAAIVKTNNNQEITGANLQNVLNSIINAVGANATCIGIATPSTNPGTPDGPVFYFALQGGTYSNFGGAVVENGLTILFWKNSNWSVTPVFMADDEPTENSQNLVKSGGTKSAINAVNDLVLAVLDTIGEAEDIPVNTTNLIRSSAVYPYVVDYDITAAKEKSYNSLLEALQDVPVSNKRGGMSLRFLNSVTGKYEQWQYLLSSTSSSNFMNTSNWRGLDDKPTENSQNLVKSGGVRSAIQASTEVALAALDTIANADDFPTEDSQELVRSGGVHAAIAAVMKEVDDNSFFVCDKNGNVVFTIDSNGISKCVRSSNKGPNDVVVHADLEGIDFDSSLQDVNDDSFFVCDENGNVVFMIDDNGISKCVQSQNKGSNDVVVHKDLGLSSFQQNITVDYYWDKDTSTRYSIVRIYKHRVDGGVQIPLLDCIAPQGNPQYSAKELAIAKGCHFVMNCAIFNINSHGEPEGVLIVNRQIINNAPTARHGDVYILTIDANGDLGAAAPNTDANALIQNGIVSACCGFSPLVVDYLETPHPESYVKDGNHYNASQMRQVIGQCENGDYAVITCEGRGNENSVGWTVPETAQICIKHGLKFAYDCDGGRSTQTIIGKKQINKDYGRKVGTYIYFNGTNSY